MPPRVLEVLLRINLDIPTRRIDVREVFAGLDHLLEQQDLVGLLEYFRLAPRPSCELLATAVIIAPQPLRPGARKLGDADILAVRLRRWDLAVNARDAPA